MKLQKKVMMSVLAFACCVTAITLVNAQNAVIDQGVSINSEARTSPPAAGSTSRRTSISDRLSTLRQANSSDSSERSLTQPNPRAVPSIPRPLQTSRRPAARPITAEASFDEPPKSEAPKKPAAIDHGYAIPLKSEGNSASSRRIAALPSRSTTPAENMLVQSSSPSLRVDLAGPNSISVGRPSSYVATLHNEGAAEAGNVIVSLTLPAWVKLSGSNATAGQPQAQTNETGGKQIIWSVDRVAASGQEQLALELTPTESRPFDVSVDWAFRPATSVARVAVLQPKLEMQIDGPVEVKFGQTRVYTIRLANPGTGPAENVMLTLQPLTVGQTPPQPRAIGTLAAGETKEIQIELAAFQAGKMEIRASASAGELKTESAHRVAIRRGHLTVAATGPRLKYARTGGVYQVSVTNDGDAPAENVVTTIKLPKGSKYLGGTEDARQSSEGLVISAGDLAAGDQRVYSVQLQLNQEGPNELAAKTTGSDELVGEAVAVTQVETIADLRLTLKDPQGPLPINTDVQYEVTILNRGTRAARDIRVVGQFSEGINPVSADGVPATISGGQALFQPISKLEPGQEITVRINAKATVPGNHVFRTELRCTDPDSRQAAEDTTRFFGDNITPSSSSRPATSFPSSLSPVAPATQPAAIQQPAPTQPAAIQAPAAVQQPATTQPTGGSDFQPAPTGPTFEPPKQTQATQPQATAAPQAVQATAVAPAAAPGKLTVPEPPSFAIPPSSAARTANGGGFVPR